MLAIILYLVFGRKRFHGYVDARRRGDRRIDHLADNLIAALAPVHATLPGESERFEVFNHLTGLPFSRGQVSRRDGAGRAPNQITTGWCCWCHKSSP